MKLTPQEINLLKIVLKLAQKRKVKLYLVGGYLRDILLARLKKNPDFDFAVRKGAINFGRDLAKKTKSGFVVLDKVHGACRLVKKLNDKIYTLDFTDYRGKNLREDLLHRDFTINSLALDLEELFKEENLANSLIDYYSGKQDLKRKIIKVTNKGSFSEDPLRILRAFSFSCILGFKIDKQTLKLLKLERNKLTTVSFERIRDELFKIFDMPNAYDFLTELDKLKILEIIFPEIKNMRGIGQGPYHHLDVWQHTLETVKQIEILIGQLKNNRKIQDYLNENISADRRKYSLIKLGAFLHDVGKPKALRREDGKIKFHGHERIGLDIAEDICRRLKLSNGEINSLRKMILCHLRPGFLADTEILTKRAKFRFFRDAQDEAISVLLISVADQRATKGSLTTNTSRFNQEKLAFGLIKEYFRKKQEKKTPRLINGDDLIKVFKLEPSPLIGKVLGEVEELQAIGKIKTKKEALSAARKFIK